MPTTYNTVATYTFPSAASSYTFSSIPQTYTDLVLVMSTVFSGSATGIRYQLNSDNGNNYAYMRMYGSSSSLQSDGDTAFTSPGSFGIIDTGINTMVINFLNYTDTNKLKMLLAKHSGVNYVDTYCSCWNSTAAINSIQVSLSGQNFSAGTNFTLYGIRKD